MKKALLLLTLFSFAAMAHRAAGDETYESSNVDYGQTTASTTLDLIWSFALDSSGGTTSAVIVGVKNANGTANPSGAITVPTSIIDADTGVGYIVKRIANGAFANQIGVTAVSIPVTVQEIGTGVFAGCTILSEITVADTNPWFTSVEGVLYDKDRTRLVACPATADSLDLPSSLTTLDVASCASCHRLTFVTVPASVTTIGSRAFTGCTLLESLTFKGNAPTADATVCDNPEDIVIYKESASTGWDVAPWTFFKEIRNTTAEVSSKILREDSGHLTWHYRITNDGAELYNNGDAVIPTGTAETYTYDTENKKWVGDGTLNLPTTLGGYPLTRIGKRAFRNCSGLSSIVIPTSVSVIDDYAFEGCLGLEDITLPNTLTELGVSPFTGTWIASLALPAKLATLHGNPVAGCENLDTLTVDTKNRNFRAVDNVLYNRKQTRLYGVQTFIEKLTVPASVAWIATNAFSSCTWLSSVTYEGNAPALDDGGESLYEDTDLDLVSHAAAGTTGWDGSSSSTNMPAGNKWPLVGSNRRAIRSLYNPSGSSEDPSTTGLFETDATGVTWYYRIVDGVAEIYNENACAVKSPTAITSLSLPVTLGSYLVKGIGTAALSNLRGITSLALPSTYEWIGDYAFSNCTSLANVTLPSGVRTIGKAPFFGTAMSTLGIPASVRSLDGNPVIGCSDLGSITVDSMNSYFTANDGLLYDKGMTTLLACPATKTSLSLPSSVTAIADDAFYGCTFIAGGETKSGDVTWSYSTAGSKTTITSAEGATGVVTIPATLGGLPVTGIDSTALNGCTGITEFVSLSAAFSAKNKCLYSADGTVLVRVPDALTLNHTLTVVSNAYRVTMTAIPGTTTLNNLNVIQYKYTYETNVVQNTRRQIPVAGDLSFETLLKDVVIIRDFAFNGCNLLTGTQQAATNGISSQVFHLGDNRLKSVTVTEYTSSQTTNSTKLLLSPSVRKVEPLALANSGVTYDGELPYLTVESYPYTVEVSALNAANAVALAETEFFPLASPHPELVSDTRYRAYFTLNATPVGGKSGTYAVTAVLDKTAIEFAKSQSQMAAKISEIAAGTAESVKLSVKPGLYYSIYSSATATGRYGLVDCRLATGTELELLMTRPSSNSGFYYLDVTPANPQK